MKMSGRSHWTKKPRRYYSKTQKKPTVRSLNERDELVLAHLKLVYMVWHRWKYRFPYCRLEEDDAVSAGRIGLIRAAELWLPDAGAAFSTYACTWILQSMQKAAHKTFTIYAPPYTTADDRPKMEPLNDVVKDKLKAKPHGVSPALVIDFEQLITCLAGTRRTVIRRVYLDGMRLIDVAKEMGLSRQRVDQIHQQALKRLYFAIRKQQLDAQESA